MQNYSMPKHRSESSTSIKGVADVLNPKPSRRLKKLPSYVTQITFRHRGTDSNTRVLPPRARVMANDRKSSTASALSSASGSTGEDQDYRACSENGLCASES